MWSVASFYDERLIGLEKSETGIEDWSRVEELAHEWVSNGGYVEIKDDESGKSIVLDYDSYFEDFEGEFPVKPEDFEEKGALLDIDESESFDEYDKER